MLETSTLYALLSKSIRIFSGPLSLFFISSFLSAEEIAFYYSFISVIATQQLLELGIGYVIKQHIAHALISKKSNIKGYVKFSFFWYGCIAVLIVIGGGGLGYWYFISIPGEVEWQGAWFFLIFSSVVSLLCQPINFTLEGLQYQELCFRTQLCSNIFATGTLCISLYFGFGLYSLGFQVLSACIIATILQRKKFISLCKKYDITSSFYLLEFKQTLIEVWPMLSRVSLVWGAGYFFWNSFGLIALKVFELKEAGKLLFTLAIGRAGLSVALSVVQSQSTRISRLISEKDFVSAKLLHKKALFMSVILGLSGYSLLLILYKYTDIYLFSKLADIQTVFYVFLYYMLVLFQSGYEEYLRCFKMEPYVKLYMTLSILIPCVFYGYSVSGLNVNYIFLPCSLIMLFSIFYTVCLRVKFEKKGEYEKEV